MRGRDTTTIDVVAMPVSALLADDVDLIKLDVEGTSAARWGTAVRAGTA